MAGLAYPIALSSTLTAKTLRIPMNFATLGGYNIGASHIETSLFSNQHSLKRCTHQALDVFGLGSCSDAGCNWDSWQGFLVYIPYSCHVHAPQKKQIWRSLAPFVSTACLTEVGENKSYRCPELSKGIMSMVTHRLQSRNRIHKSAFACICYVLQPTARRCLSQLASTIISCCFLIFRTLERFFWYLRGFNHQHPSFRTQLS